MTVNESARVVAYLFDDEELFGYLIDGIPHARLTAPFRKDKQLRNRRLKGQRVASDHPAKAVLAQAILAETTQDQNGRLSQYLCANWTAERLDLLTDALEFLAIETKEPQKFQWRDQLDELLEDKGIDLRIPELVHELAPFHEGRDIHILSCLLSYSFENQSLLRELVTEHLAKTRSDLGYCIGCYKNRIAKLESSREEAASKIGELEGEVESIEARYEEEVGGFDQDIEKLNEELEKLDELVSTKELEKARIEDEIQGVREQEDGLVRKRRTLSANKQRKHQELDQEKDQCVTGISLLKLDLEELDGRIRTSNARIDELTEQEEQRKRELEEPAIAVPTPASDAGESVARSIDHREWLHEALGHVLRPSFSPSVASLLILRDFLVPVKEGQVALEEPADRSHLLASEWAGFYAGSLLSETDSWNRAELAEFAYWHSHQLTVLSRRESLELLASGLFHAAPERDDATSDRLLSRLVQVWTGLETATDASEDLDDRLISKLSAQLADSDSREDFGWLQLTIALADSRSLMRFYDGLATPVKIRCKQSLIDVIGEPLGLSDREPTHELLDAVCEEVGAKSAPLSSSLRQWWGRATLETLERDRNRVLSSLARFSDLFGQEGESQTSCIRTIFGQELTQAARRRSPAAYQALTGSIETQLGDSLTHLSHLSSRYVIPYLVILWKALKEATVEVQQTLFSRLSLELEKSQHPLTDAPRDISIGLKLSNDGNTDAESVSMMLFPSRDADQSVEIKNDHVQSPGNVAFGAVPETIDMEMRISQPCEAVELEYVLDWSDASSNERTKSGTLKLLAQREIDWEKARQNPFTFRSISDPNRLYGREHELDKLREGVRSLDSYLLTGQRRVGKSSVARVLGSQVDQIPNYCSTYVSLGELSLSSPGQFLMRLFEMVEDELQAEMAMPEDSLKPSPEDFEGDPQAAAARYLRFLRRSYPNTKLLIILDDFDELPVELYRGPDGDRLFLFLRSLIDGGLASLVFVGGERLPGIVSYQGERMNQVQSVALDHLKDSLATSDLLRRPAMPFLDFSDEVVDFVHCLSAGNPFYATKIAKTIYDDMVASRDHSVCLADAQRNVQRILEEDEIISYQHYWKEGVAVEGEEAETFQHINALILIALAEQESGGVAVTQEALFETNLLRDQDSSLAQSRLHNLLERKVVSTAPNGYLRIRVPLVSKWLAEGGSAAVRLSFGPKDIDYMFPTVARKAVSDSAIVEIARDLVYQGNVVNEVKIRMWLEQFRGERSQRVAFKLLQRLKESGYFGVSHMHTALRELHRMVVADLLDSSEWSQKVKNKKVVNVFVSHFGREGKSGAALLYGYRQANNTVAAMAGSMTDGLKYLETTKKGGVLVFVDDFIGTGGTCREGYENLVEAAEKTGIDLSEHFVFICAIAGTEAGLSSAGGSCPNLSGLYVSRRLGSADQAFSPDAEIFSSEEERAYAESLCRSIGEQLDPRQPLGYESAQSLVVFSHRCPNNTIPIFHKTGAHYEGRKWEPIFPR